MSDCRPSDLCLYCAGNTICPATRESLSTALELAKAHDLEGRYPKPVLESYLALKKQGLNADMLKALDKQVKEYIEEDENAFPGWQVSSSGANTKIPDWASLWIFLSKRGLSEEGFNRCLEPVLKRLKEECQLSGLDWSQLESELEELQIIEKIPKAKSLRKAAKPKEVSPPSK